MNPGALGPSLDYSNPDVLDYEDYPDGGAFNLETCDHQEMDPEILQGIQDSYGNIVTRNPDVDPEYQLNQQLLLEDQGIDPPPWVRFPEIFHTPVAEFGMQWEEGFVGDAAAVLTGPFSEYWQQDRALVANPQMDPEPLLERHRAGERPIGSIHDRVGVTYEKWGLKGQKNILSLNAKLQKGQKECYMTYGLNLMPWTLSGIGNMCPYASKGCSAACLHMSGQAEVLALSGEMVIVWSRWRKTILLFNNRPLLTKLLDEAIRWVLNKASRGDDVCDQYTPCFRLNVLSDVRWESMRLPFDAVSDTHPTGGNRMTVFDRFPDTVFYDYTKNPQRMQQFIAAASGYDRSGNWPGNYYLTFSWSEINARIAFAVLDAGGNVAVPFDVWGNTDLPQEFCGYPVIDADLHDMRFLDIEQAKDLREQYGTGVICGLRLKGMTTRRSFREAKSRERVNPRTGFREHIKTGGFVQYSDEAGVIEGHYDASRNVTRDPEYKAMLIAESDQRTHEQAQDPQGAKERPFRAAPKWWGIGD